MKIHDQKAGKDFFKKTRKRIDEPRHARELTFSCYKGYKFLDRDRTRSWFLEQLDEARQHFHFDLWAYVIMPEHVHVLVYPDDNNLAIGIVMGTIKEKVARPAIKFLKAHAPHWISRITVQEGDRVRRRFWQPGGGYDRNAVELATVGKMIEYIHMNPVRRGLVARPEDWPWSSARWYAGILPVPIELDKTLPASIEIGKKP
jgi:putative transposase